MEKLILQGVENHSENKLEKITTRRSKKKQTNNNKIKFTVNESISLLNHHRQKNSQWKIIAIEFPQRTRNEIKNHFFSLMRKSFRKICKYYKIQSSNIY